MTPTADRRSRVHLLLQLWVVSWRLWREDAQTSRLLLPEVPPRFLIASVPLICRSPPFLSTDSFANSPVPTSTTGCLSGLNDAQLPALRVLCRTSLNSGLNGAFPSLRPTRKHVRPQSDGACFNPLWWLHSYPHIRRRLHVDRFRPNVIQGKQLGCQSD